MTGALKLCSFDAALALRPAVPTLFHAGRTDQCGTFYPEDDSPSVIVVGSMAEPSRIHALARRHGMESSLLLQFARQGEAA